MEVAPAEEPRENAPAEMPASEDVPTTAVVEAEERGQPAQAEGDGGGPLAPSEPAVADLEAESETPVPLELVRVNDLGAEDDHPAPSEPEAEGATAEAGEEEAPATANENGAGPVNEREVEPTDSFSSSAQAAVWHAVRKVPTQPPQPPLRFSAMEDARQAERLLERVHLPRFRAQLRRKTAADLLDAMFMSVLQTANEILALRDTIIQSSNSTAHSHERVAKYRGWCKEVAEKFAQKLEEAKAQENDLGGKLLTSEVNRDEWRAWYREAESKAATELVQTAEAEAELAVVSARLASTEGRVEELTQWLKDAESQADVAKTEVHAAEGRAVEARLSAQEAEERVTTAEAAARETELKMVEAVARTWDAQARVEEAEA